MRKKVRIRRINLSKRRRIMEQLRKELIDVNVVITDEAKKLIAKKTNEIFLKKEISRT
ncbi:MAG: hypothetical protein AB1420_02685 [Bacillota bacterium]